MITPVFEVRQDEDYVFVEMRVPHMKVSSFDFCVEEDLFKFFARPYFLRLVFPGRLVEDGREQAAYDLAAGLLTVRLPKATSGESFADLDLLTLLQAPSRARPSRPSVAPIVELMERSGGESEREREGERERESEGGSEAMDVSEEQSVPEGQQETLYHPLAGTTAEEWDWEWVAPPAAAAAAELLQQFPLGFGGGYGADYFCGLEEELTEVVECPRPGAMSPSELRAAREECETENFCIDHYLCDLLQNSDFVSALLHEPCHALSSAGAASALSFPAVLQGSDEAALRVPRSLQVFNDSFVSASVSAADSAPASGSVFTAREQEQLRQLRFKEFALTQEQERAALLSLVDVLFAYLFDLRVMQGEHTVESAWAVCQVSATLSWLDSFESLAEVVRSCMRRSLAYPMCRHVRLSLAVLADTAAVLAAGKRAVLKCLLAARRLLTANEFKKHLNALFLDDYCVWIQRVSPKALSSLAAAVEAAAGAGAGDLGWNLAALEEEARSFSAEFPMEFEDPQANLRPTADPSLAEDPTGEERMEVDSEGGEAAGAAQPLIQVVHETDV
mmetsp:Transcript_1211/g.4351  ORF Transcript_1211/g.4351 Transcript_1211/m.4351 type:complete len:562 (+) Transcript_1211:30-1715(+)